MAILKFLNQNGEWEVAETPAAVKYTEQTLTDAQKAQVKSNLGITEPGTPVHIGTELSDYKLSSGKGTLELAIGSEKPWQVGDLYIDTVYNSIYRCTSYTAEYTYTWELVFGELVSSVHTGTELYDNSNGSITNNQVYLNLFEETQSWKAGDLYIDTAFNAVFKCTDSYFRGYYGYTWDLIADLNEAVREFDYVNGFNWGQFLGEPTFIKVNFPEGREFYLYCTDADGNTTTGDPIRPKTLFLNISTEITDDYKLLHLETVVNRRSYRTTMYFNKDTDAVVMTSSTMAPVPDSYSKVEADNKFKSMIVEITANDDDTWSSSKTPAEIYTHVQNGGTVYAKRYDDFWSLQYASSSEAQFCTYTDDGFIYRMWIWESYVEIQDDDPGLVTSTNLKNYLDNNNVAYRSDLPTAIPTSTIDALFS